MVKKRRRHTAAFKFRVALEALEGSKTISQLSSEYEIHANLIRAWKRQLQEDGPRVFATNGERKQREQEAQEAELYEQIGRLKMELEWLKKSCPLRSGRGGQWSIASMRRSVYGGRANCSGSTAPPSTSRRRPSQR